MRMIDEEGLQLGSWGGNFGKCTAVEWGRDAHPSIERVGSEGGVGGALIAAGGEDIVDYPALRTPFGHSAGAGELRVVRMGDDDHGGERAVLAQLLARRRRATPGPPAEETIQVRHG